MQYERKGFLAPGVSFEEVAGNMKVAIKHLLITYEDYKSLASGSSFYVYYFPAGLLVKRKTADSVESFGRVYDHTTARKAFG